MIKDFVWIFYSTGALIGILAANNDNNFDVDRVALNAGRYADKMLDEFRNRYDQGYKGR